MNTSEKIKMLRTQKGLSQEELGKIVGLQKAAINKYETGRVVNIKKSMLQKLADALDVSPADLLDDYREDYSDITNLSFPAARPLPILGTICAGDGVFCEENYSGYFFVDNSIRADLCLTVRGDSMTGLGIQDGDIAFIRKTDTVTNGKVYAIRINSDSEAVLKSLYIDGDKAILNSANPDYAPIITTTDNISVIGALVGTYHSLK